jgi:hypothetical protein
MCWRISELVSWVRRESSYLRTFWTGPPANNRLVQPAEARHILASQVLLIEAMGRALEAKEAEESLARLQETIREIVTEPGDYLCWRDVFLRLGALVGIEFDPLLLPPGQHLAQCACFVASLHSGKPYDPDALSREVKELRQRVAELERENAALAGACES